MFLMAIGKAEKCLAGCQVTKHKSKKCFYSTNHLGALDCQKQGGHACIRALHLGNGIMGACFQAPCATPGQRQMETSSWIGLDVLFVAPYKSHKGKIMNNNNNNNKFWQQKYK